MEKRQEIYEWMVKTGSSQQQAAEHFSVNQSYVSRAIRSYAHTIGKVAPDKRVKGNIQLMRGGK